MAAGDNCVAIRDINWLVVPVLPLPFLFRADLHRILPEATLASGGLLLAGVGTVAGMTAAARIPTGPPGRAGGIAAKTAGRMVYTQQTA
jgi:hypothetical protein